MKYNELRDGIKISELSFGCARLGKSIHEDNSGVAHNIIDLAIDLGINYFDTASNYSYGDSEKILGSYLKKTDKNIIVSTKGGMELSHLAKYGLFLRPFFKYIKPLAKSNQVKSKNTKITDHSIQNLSLSLKRSSKRLGLSPIPIFKLHNPSPEVLKNPGIPAFFNTIKEKEKVTLTGISISSITEIESCTYIDEIDIIQFPINYLEFKPEHYDILLDLTEKNIGLIGRAPFKRGLLTSANHIKTGSERGFVDQRITARKAEICREFSIDEIQLALWFLKDLRLLDSILFSSFNPHHLKENVNYNEATIPVSFSWKDLVGL
ncbi:MAG: hypothetical protein HKN68_06730 [Saprospiraceae bacterium]|nr:hypothetical protein [Saprospiraceae bacterium]